MTTAGRKGAVWRRTRSRVLAAEPTCAICGHPIDHDAPPRTRWAPSVDHVTPLSKGGDPLTLANLRATHYGCNASKRDGRTTRPTTGTSRTW